MIRKRTTGKVDTIIGTETVVKGDFRVVGGFRLDGQIEGKIEITEMFLAGPRALLKGEVRCASALIAGRIEGNIFASETVELQRGAQLFGNITCRALVIQPGCFFEGNCSMVRGDSGQPDVPPSQD